jgi:hypothetical protein
LRIRLNAIKIAARKRAPTFTALLIGAACAAWGQPDRYLYVLSCDARIGKLDTVLDRQVSSQALSATALKKQVFPHVQENETIDGCLANYVVFDTKASVFYTVVPEQARLKADGTKDYQMVSFSVPGLAPVNVVPAGTALTEAPHLELGVGQPKVVPASEWSPQTDLDVSTFAPQKQDLRNQILEESGSLVLLRVFTPNKDELALAVADQTAKSMVELKDVVLTSARSVHLTPSGEAVWVEETDNAGAKTGNAVLYDARTGREIKRFADSRVKTMSFLAISPSGKAIYHSGSEYAFLSLGQKFSSGSVVRLLNANSYPPVFFARR